MNQQNWQWRVVNAIVVLLVIAIGARAIYTLLAPLLPFLGAVVVIVVVYALMFRGWRR